LSLLSLKPTSAFVLYLLANQWEPMGCYRSSKKTNKNRNLTINHYHQKLIVESFKLIWKVGDIASLAKTISNELSKTKFWADCMCLTRAAIRSRICTTICDGKCKISWRMQLPTKRDPELSNLGSSSLFQNLQEIRQQIRNREQIHPHIRTKIRDDVNHRIQVG